jgi:hypothetical protein
MEILSTGGLHENAASLRSRITRSAHVTWDQILNSGRVVAQKYCIIVIPMIILMLLV